MTKTNQRVMLSKRMLREGLIRLLQDKELDKIRVNELCEESGINRSTFYRYYSSPRDVLSELEQEFSSRMIPTKPAESRSEELAALEDACTFIYENADTAKLLFCCNTTEKLQQRMSTAFLELWGNRENAAYFDAADETTVRLSMMFTGGGCYTLLRDWIMNDLPKTPKEIAEIINNIIQWPEKTT